MKCPNCEKNSDHVLDTRTNKSKDRIKRRRECFSCDYKFSTIEINVEEIQSDLLKINKLMKNIYLSLKFKESNEPKS